jgi:hypothetical protein
MKKLLKNLLPGAVIFGFFWGGAAAQDLHVVEQWKGKFPVDKVIDDKPLWDQPVVQAAMRAAMGEQYFALSQKAAHSPEAPVTDDGNGIFVAWTCIEGADCSGNNMTVFFDSASGNAQVCWRSSEGIGGKVQDLWLSNGTARPLPINGCGVGEKNPFASLKKFGSAK